MTVITRFAPSPTGYLHIGGARTALFNWLFSKHMGGTFRLRIEDTDRQRSTEDAKAKIIEGLEWLGLSWDGEIVYQFARAARHAEVAHEMLARGHAYRCYASPEELTALRAQQQAAKQPLRYDGRWRDRDARDAPPGIKPVIRLKAPQSGETFIEDKVQGAVRVANETLDDMILLRADGTPTYMLSVVVDDHDMAITHVIRGDDHLTNAFRQFQIYQAMGWSVPEFAHIPLIHGADGAKLSKRHGATGLEEYRDMGFLPEAMRNYLLRLGWGHGDTDIVATEEAVRLFGLEGIGRSPSRLDMAKLLNMNGHYLRAAEDARLAQMAAPMIEKKLGRALSPLHRERLAKGMSGLKQRAKTLVEIADAALFYCQDRPVVPNDKAKKLLDDAAKARLRGLAPLLDAAPHWNEPTLEGIVKAHAEASGLKLGDLAQPLRAALTGSNMSPGLFEVMALLGKAESLGRIADAAG